MKKPAVASTKETPENEEFATSSDEEPHVTCTPRDCVWNLEMLASGWESDIFMKLTTTVTAPEGTTGFECGRRAWFRPDSRRSKEWSKDLFTADGTVHANFAQRRGSSQRLLRHLRFHVEPVAAPRSSSKANAWANGTKGSNFKEEPLRHARRHLRRWQTHQELRLLGTTRLPLCPGVTKKAQTFCNMQIHLQDMKVP